MKIALSVAGFDPTSGAGVTADLRVFNSEGVYGLSVISAITAQNTQGVQFVQGVGIEAFDRQLDVLLSDIRPDAIKTGILYDAQQIDCLIHHIKTHSLTNLVIDPVMVSSSGMALVAGDNLAVVRDRLLPLAAVVTPNVPEAQLLAGIDIHSRDDLCRAAWLIHDASGQTCAVLITGGHLAIEAAVDVLYDGDTFSEFEAPMLERMVHGTGCMFSAAVAANLARGLHLRDAVSKAKSYITSSPEMDDADKELFARVIREGLLWWKFDDLITSDLDDWLILKTPGRVVVLNKTTLAPAKQSLYIDDENIMSIVYKDTVWTDGIAYPSRIDANLGDNALSIKVEAIRFD
ncbi:phosphomethylpyrimidine kinase [Candidatus Magnetobacterium bavaricum]|uniref:hydroxymethylpyrimidine kinase n=1 Tax=Candidatus Magnetobacterium bavaricum TaxID=29290 RepID=A0A0F3GQH4_9BACT|nr:phosphomethylpyrimidine kinase [Candidatus Magnetobacterium bavaricum]